MMSYELGRWINIARHAERSRSISTVLLGQDSNAVVQMPWLRSDDGLLIRIVMLLQLLLLDVGVESYQLRVGVQQGNQLVSG